MSAKNKKTARCGASARVGSDLMMNRLMLFFVIAVGAVTLIMSLRNLRGPDISYRVVRPVMLVISGLAAALTLAVSVYRFFVKKDDRLKIFTKNNLLCIGIVSVLCFAAYILNPIIAAGFSVVIVLGVMLLCFIWYAYPQDFFALSAACLAEGLMLVCVYGYEVTSLINKVIQYGCRAGSVLLPAALMVYALMSRKKANIRILSVVIWCAVSCVGAVLLLLGAWIPVPYLAVLLADAAVFVVLGIAETLRML